MSSFKRRLRTAPPDVAGASAASSTTGSSLPKATAARTNQLYPPGVKSGTWGTSTPVVSVGLGAIDDLVSGGGQPVGSTMLLVPTLDTHPVPPAAVGDDFGLSPGAAALASAEPYLDLVLAHGIAQGIASKHYNIVVSDLSSAYVHSVPRRIGEEQSVANVAQEPVQPKKEEEEKEKKEKEPPSSSNSQDKYSNDKLNIAFRYERMSVASSDVPSEKSDFCAAYDLHRRIHPSLVKDAQDAGQLILIEPSTEPGSASAYDSVIQTIEMSCQRILDSHSPDAGLPIIHISIRGLGGLAWGEAPTPAVVRFMLRLRRLVRTLSPPAAPAKAYAVAGVSLSASCISSTDGGRVLPIQLAHISDAALSMSSFSASGPGLRQTLAGRYTGAVHVLRAPALGQLTDGSARASVLRGLGATSVVQTRSGTSTATVGGAGWGGENNLAFSVRRRTFKVELLQVDEPGQDKPTKENPTKPSSSSSTLEVPPTPSSAPTAPAPSSATVPASASVPQETSSLKKLAPRGAFQPSGHAPPSSSTATPPPPPSPAPATAPATTTAKSAAGGAGAGKGLAFLRARGQQVRTSKHPAVEVEDGSPSRSTSHQPPSRPGRGPPVQAARDAKDLEF